jgi:hypothetical protein
MHSSGLPRFVFHWLALSPPRRFAHLQGRPRSVVPAAMAWDQIKGDYLPTTLQESSTESRMPGARAAAHGHAQPPGRETPQGGIRNERRRVM